MIEPAPPYRGEGPHALWHVSEDAVIERFTPRGGKVWSIDTRHLPLYWFPRACPRATFWAKSGTTEEDVDELLGGDRGRRVHVVEPEWLDALHKTRVFAYRMQPETFERWDRAVLAVLPSVHGAESNLELSRQFLLGDVASLTDLPHKGTEVDRSLRRDRIRHLTPW